MKPNSQGKIAYQRGKFGTFFEIKGGIYRGKTHNIFDKQEKIASATFLF